MKVSGATKAKSEGTAAASAGTKSAGKAVSAVTSVQQSFNEVVEDVETQRLISELDSVGSMLTQHPTTALMSRYRQLVGMALEKVKNASQLKREFKWKRTERAMYITIARTEEALEELDEAIMKEADRVKVLALIDEIKGCLISLLF